MKRKSIAQLKKDAQKLVNKYIRLRDSDGYFFKCISCGNIFPVSEMDAGHFFSAGSYDSIRFDHDNIHGQCRVSCNNLKEGNQKAYEENLIVKIGLDRYSELCEKAEGYKRNLHFWQRDELEEIIKTHKEMIKQIEFEENMPF